MFKILLIAYACEPNKGSEPGVGWNWAIHLAKYVDVTVITRANNKDVIEKKLIENPVNNLKFIYYDIPILKKIKKKIPFGTQLYFLLWEYFVIKKIKNFNYDIIQRITFVTTVTLLRSYNFSVPYIHSFVGGGELSPISIYGNYNIKYKLKEIFRIFYNSMYKYNFITQKTFNSSKIVLAVSEETKNFIQKLGYKGKIKVVPAIGINNSNFNKSYNCKYKIIYAGSFIYLKNIDIIVKALCKAENGKIRLDLFGAGSELKKLKRLVYINNCADRIVFRNKICHSSLLEKFKNYNLAIHASSHDSGSLFILEAISYGLPVLFLNTGGPKEIFNGIDYPLKVNPNLSYNEIVNEFSEKINWFYENYNDFMERFGEYRKLILKKYLWDNKAKQMVEIYKEILNENPSSS